MRFRLRRRRAARQRPDLAAIPRREGRGHARGPVESLGPEAPAHREARRLRLHVARHGGRRSNLPGGWLRIPLQGEFYVGLGVCSHDKDVVEKAVFSNVELTQPASGGEPVLYSTLETVAIDSADRRVAYLAPGRFEAPNWTRDGSAFLFNRDGHIERLPSAAASPTRSTPVSRIAATTITASRPTARSSPSATIRRETTTRSSTSFRSPAARRAASRRNLLRTGTAGRRTERRWPSSASATAISTSTRFRPRAAKRRG